MASRTLKGMIIKAPSGPGAIALLVALSEEGFGLSYYLVSLAEEVLDLYIDSHPLAKAGSMLGSGPIIVFEESPSIVDVAYKTAHFYRHESCGKCSPCREGTNWTEKMLLRIKNGDATPMDLDIMASVCEQIMGNC